MTISSVLIGKMTVYQNDFRLNDDWLNDSCQMSVENDGTQNDGWWNDTLP